MAAAQLRQGAVPGPVPARPPLSPAAARRREGGDGRGVSRQAAGVPGGEGRPLPDRTRRQDPRRHHPRSQGSRRSRHEDPRGVRRPRPARRLLQPGHRPDRRVEWGHLNPAVRPPVDRRARAAEAVRHRGAEAQVPPSGGPRPTSAPSSSPSTTSAPTRPACPPRPSPPRTARATSSTAASCGPPTDPSPTCSSSWRWCPSPKDSGAASPPSSSTPVRRASPWSTATPSWACGASRTASPASRTCSSPRRTWWPARASASRWRSAR